jgi:hypothetical protein
VSQSPTDRPQDKNVAEWETLSKEEQEKRLAEKPEEIPEF